MRTIQANSRRRSWLSTVLLTLLAIVLGGGGTVAALAFFKMIDPAKLAFWRKPEPIPADWVAIPRCIRPIPAYTRVTRDYLINPNTGTWFVNYLPPEKVPKGVLTDISKIRGRVTAYAVEASLYFKEDDFLPEGSLPGIAGGTPPGKRAYTLDASKLKGASDLNRDDHVDLLASIPVDMPGAGNSGRMGMVAMTPKATLLPKRCFVRPLVQDGVVVSPVHVRNMPTTSNSLTQGANSHMMPMQEIVIAVEPGEVGLLAEALDLKYEITCAVHSGQPSPAAAPSPTPRPSAGGGWQALAAFGKALFGADHATALRKTDSTTHKVTAASHTSETPVKDRVAMDITPGLDPFAEISGLEVMIGRERQFMLFTGPNGSPVPSLQSDESAAGGGGVVPAGAVEESKE